ncbi:hypothetical protein NIES592_19035 [Fischerella major NIES-592]|nr:hypothetical protein NIES592_19035 [Fischerella major NIES-592]
MAQDRTFLGIVSPNRYDSDSICNRYGDYGSRYGNGIFNRYGKYGDRYSEQSAYNPRAEHPPLLIKNQQIIGFVSKNPKIANRYDPDMLQIEICQER